MNKLFILKVQILLFIITLFGCNQLKEEYTSDGKEFFVRECIGRMHYYKDSRTNTCFAAWEINDRFGPFTYVPCSPEIEKLIK